jgi:hypothetical protein
MGGNKIIHRGKEHKGGTMRSMVLDSKNTVKELLKII